MSITVKRVPVERRNMGTITFDITGSDVGKTYDFMGILKGFRITDVNVTVDQAFANADNTIAVGTEADKSRFITATAMNAIKGIAFNNRQLSANTTMSILATIAGTASATGKATITVQYVKQPDSRQEY